MPLYLRISPLIKKTFHFAGLFFFLLSLFSCGFHKTTIVRTDVSTGEISVSDLGFVKEGEIFSAIAHINVFQRGNFYPVKMALIIKRPAYLRLELLPVIGAPDFFLTVSPETMKIFIPSKGEFYSGQPTVSNFKKFLPWPLEMDDTVMIFTGTYPSLGEDDIAYQMHREGDLRVVDMQAPSGASQIIWLDDDNKLLKLIRKDQAGEELYIVHYTYGDGHLAVPEKIKLDMVQESAALSIKYSDTKIEKTNDVSVFDLTVPENIKEIFLE